MPITIPYPSEKIQPFVAYLALGLECNVSVVNSVVWHSRLILPCRIVDRILRFVSPSCKARVLRIESRGLWGLQQDAMLEAVVRLIVDGVFTEDQTFLLAQTQPLSDDLLHRASEISKLLHVPRAASVHDFVFTRRGVARAYGHLEVRPAIAMVDDYTTCAEVENLKDVVDKIVLCTSRAYDLDEPLRMQEEE